MTDKYKRVLAWVLLAALCLAQLLPRLSVAAAEIESAKTERVETEGTGTENEIHLSCPEDLDELSRNCVLDTWSADKVVVLDCDIDLNETDFSPIPTFGGTFLGKGHTISGFALEGGSDYTGFFRYIQEEGSVCDLKLSGSAQAKSTQEGLALFAGRNYGLISGCTASGSLTGGNQVGMLAGSNEITGIITDCTSEGFVYGNHVAGGIAGANCGSILNSLNRCHVNTVVSDSDLDLSALTLRNIFTTENAASVTDIGGIAGSNFGVIRACVNDGAVGYQHVGYNIGGIAGSQTGYIEGCVNYGVLNGRKDVGGIAGQMEPSSEFEFSEDTLARLHTEFNRLHDMITQLLNDAQGASDSLTGQVESLLSSVEDTQRAIDTIAGQTSADISGFSELTDLSTLPTPHPVSLDFLDQIPVPSATPTQTPQETSTPQGSESPLPSQTPEEEPAPAPTPEDEPGDTDASAESFSVTPEKRMAAPDPLIPSVLCASVAEDGSLPSGDAGAGEPDEALQETDTTPVETPAPPEATPAQTPETTPAPVPEETPAQTPESTQEPPAASPGESAPLPTALPQATPSASPDWTDLLPSMSPQFPLPLPSDFDLDFTFDREAAEDEINRVQDNLYDSASSVLEGINDLIERRSLLLSARISSAQQSLSGSFSGILSDMRQLNALLREENRILVNDFQAISDQLNLIGNIITAPDTGNDEIVVDVSDEDEAGDTSGKVMNCVNRGKIYGDLNVGGIAGSLSRENNQDPEDDFSIDRDSLTLNFRYKERIVIRESQNSGVITGKKDCIGGIAGNMTLGSVIDCIGNGDVSGEGNMVGGIAGLSKSTIRGSSAKCALSGCEQVGGIAGCGKTILDCFSMVEITEGENYLGSIAGKADVSDEIRNNYFVEGCPAGIDGVSYFEAAAPVPYSEFMTLPKLPDIYRDICLTFMADDQIISTVTLSYGESFDVNKLPKVPPKDGCSGRWEDFDSSSLTFDQTINALYSEYVSTLESVQREGSRPVALVEGSFESGERFLLSDITAYPQDGKTKARCHKLSISGGNGPYTVRYLIPSDMEDAQIEIYENHAWIPVETERDGSYYLFQTDQPELVFCCVERPDSSSAMMICALCAAAAVLVLLLLFIRHRRIRRKRPND